MSIRLGLVVGLLFAILVTYLASLNPGRAHLALGGDWAVDVPLMFPDRLTTGVETFDA